MMTRKLLVVFGFFFILNGAKTLLAQSTYPLILNEYNVSNVPNGYADEKGMLNDYVELYNNHTETINLSGFYLSNDRNNLFKWKFPANFPQLAVGGYALVWLSGKNTNDGTNFHTNFNIEQCKNQYIILTKASGELYDSIYVQPTKAGHVRGRVDMDNRGIAYWRLFTSRSPKFANGNPTAEGYAPTPKIFLTTATNFAAMPNAGSFSTEGSIAYMKLEGHTYDTTFSCFDIFYTLNGDYPVAFYNGSMVNGTYFRYPDSLVGIAVTKTTIIRAIAVPKPNRAGCPVNTLESFCETNTYFIDPEYNAFSPEFGVISIALDKADTAWFNSQGAPSASIHVEYYDDKQQMSEGYAMINRPPQEEWRTAQRGFYINKDDRMGFGCNFEGNVFNVEGLGTSERKVFPTLHLKGGDYESHSAGGSFPLTTSYGTGVRDVVMQSLAAKYNLHVSPLHVKPVVAFVNGIYWGVYDLREVYDKYYEEFYNGQSPELVDLNFVHNCQEGSVSAWDGAVSRYSANATFNTTVYKPSQGKMANASEYNTVMKSLDKESFIDYMVLNSYGMNSDLWCNNVTVAKGGDPTKPGAKWHFYLWNMPSVFNFTAVAPTGVFFGDPGKSPCYLYNSINPQANLYQPTINAFNGHGNMMTHLMANPGFKNDYIARYQDLLNGPLKCDNITKHFDYVQQLYSKEMKYHEDIASTPTKGRFATSDVNHVWDTNMAVLKKVIDLRCYNFIDKAFGAQSCYGLAGPFPISVDVRPMDAGKVKLNTTVLDSYTWYGLYYQQTLSFKAIPASSDYIFHHWEITGPASKDPLSKDSIALNFNIGGNITAVFTDKRNDITYKGEAANIPTGFTPNGDGLNDDFRPLGSGEFATEYQMTIFNRWGQQVFRSVDPLTGWDGTFRGEQAQTGVYAYYISYKNIYLEDKLLKGNVTLTR